MFRSFPMKTRWPLRSLGSLLVLAAGCTMVKGPDGEDQLRGMPEALSLELGASSPREGDLVDGADTSFPAATLTSVQPFAGPLHWQVQLSTLKVVEKEDNVISGGKFGSFRQDTVSYGLTLGPRLAWATSEAGPNGGGAGLGVFADGGFGLYYTTITGRFPRGKNDPHQVSDSTLDLGTSLGGGVVVYVSEHVFLGVSVRVHMIFIRFEKGEKWFDSEDEADQRIRALIFADQEGGRSDDIGILTAGLTVGMRF